MYFKIAKRDRFYNKNKMQGIEAFANSLGTEIAVFENAISYPVTNDGAVYDFRGGLIDSETLKLIEEAILSRHNKPCQAMPELVDKNIEINKLTQIEGTFLFGGILLNNFGHFLLESIGRLWAYGLFKKFDPYILFYAPWGIPDYQKKNNYVHQVFKALGIPLNRLVFFTEIVQLKKVIIPEQKYGFGKCRMPDNTFINFIQSFNLPNRIRVNASADKIYVSRSKLPFNQGRPFGETEFEKYLQSNGYLIIYPEKHTLYQQLAIYKTASKIIFCDGGAMYGTILLPNLNADIAIVARRRDPRWNYKELTEHFYGYKKSVLWIDEIISQYQYGMETWDAAGEIDWYKVGVTLQKEKFVTSTFEGLETSFYKDLKRKELQQYIESIHTNPIFLNYMEKIKEEYPILPNSF